MPTTVLGISAGSRTMGIAVLYGVELVEWQVKNFEGRWGERRLHVILASYVQMYGVTRIVIKVPHQARSSPELTAQIKAIKDFAKANKLRCTTCTIDELKKRFCSKRERKNKLSLMLYALREYPCLHTEYVKERTHTRQYYLKLFEAVLAAKFSTRNRYL